MTRARRVLFTILATLVLPALLLGVLETGLRVAGAGFDPSFFIERTVQGRRVVTDNPRFGWRFFPPEVARAPQTFSIPDPKPDGTLRVFVLGGSAAMGDPSPWAGMPRVLQALLEEGRPDREIEVVNAAMTAINSHVVLPIARDCVRRQPDALVIYLGNNEVVGPFGAGSVFGVPGAGIAVSRAHVALKSTRIGQLLDRLAVRLRSGGRAPAAWGGMEQFLGNRLAHDDPALAVVYDNFRRNLTDVCRAAERAGVPVVLSTVGVNERDCAPFASAAGEDSAERHWRAGRELLGPEADADAPVERAAAEFRRAVDRDLLRFRADSGIRQVVRDVALSFAHVTLVDGAGALAEASPHGIPGHEFFDDHVHLRLEGNDRLARAILEGLLAALPGGAAEAEAAARSAPGPEAVAERLAAAPWKRLETVRTMQARRERAPFAGGLDEAEWKARTDAEIAALEPFTQPHHLRQALARVREQRRRHPEDRHLSEDLAELLLRTGDAAGAARERAALFARFPHEAEAAYRLGVTRRAAGDRAGAEEALRAAIAINPRHFLARNELGEMLLDDGRFADAAGEFSRAVRDYPGLAVAHRNLGTARLRDGDVDGAIAALHRATEVNPDLASAHKRLGDALAEAGQRSDAAAAYREALRLNPGYQAAREKLDELAP